MMSSEQHMIYGTTNTASMMLSSNGMAMMSGGGGNGGAVPCGPGADGFGARPRPVFFWTNGEVMKWLKRHCEEYYDLYGNTFLENEITGRSLIRINEETLKRMGVDNGEHRDQLARIILKLKLKSDIIEIKDLQRKGQPFGFVAGSGLSNSCSIKPQQSSSSSISSSSEVKSMNSGNGNHTIR